jgi:hypothetical protein
MSSLSKVIRVDSFSVHQLEWNHWPVTRERTFILSEVYSVSILWEMNSILALTLSKVTEEKPLLT